MLISYSAFFFLSPWEKIDHVNEAIIAEKLTEFFFVSPVQTFLRKWKMVSALWNSVEKM